MSQPTTGDACATQEGAGAPFVRPSGSSRARRLLRSHWPLLLVAFIYLYIFPYQPGLRSPNELCRLLQTRALVDRHSIEIGDELRTYGQVRDLSCVAVARDGSGRAEARLPCPQAAGNPRFKEEHYYPSKAPLLAFAATPVYATLKLLRPEVPELALMFFARLFCLVLPSLFTLVLVRRYVATVVPATLATVVTVAYALGTLAFSYSEQFVSHQSAAICAFGCFYVSWRVRRGEWPAWGYALAGLLAGLTVAAEYTGALVLLPLGAYGLATAPGGTRGRLRALGYALAGLLPPVLALAAYHQAAFASPIATGYRYLNDAGYQGWHRGGFLGIKLPKAHALVQSFFSPLRGLFALSPMLVLAVLYLLDPRALRRRSAELWVSFATLVLYTYFTSSFAYESWGWTTGPRHLTSLVPFLLLPLALVLRSLTARPGDGRPAGTAAWQVVLGGVTLGLVVLSVLATSVATLLNYISDTFTNGLYGVALPMAARGYLPHSWLSLAGVPNPWAALPALAALGVTVAWLALTLVQTMPPGRRLPVGALGAVVLAAVVALHASVRPPQDRVVREQQAAEFMRVIHVPKPFQAPPRLWSK